MACVTDVTEVTVFPCSDIHAGAQVRGCSPYGFCGHIGHIGHSAFLVGSRA